MIEVKVNVIPQCSDGDIKHWIQFFSEIENVEKVPHDAMQNDILYYLNALKYFKDKSEEMQKALNEVDEIIEEFYEHSRIREKYKPIADEVKMIHKIILQALKGGEFK